LYSGQYTNWSDILFTSDGKHLYRGQYTNWSDIILTVDAMVPIPVLISCL
jgi:hypothetical protein